MTKLPVALTAAALVLFSAGAGFAQQKGVKINGVAANTTVASGNVNAASGFLASAHQSIGAIRGGTEVNGVLTNTTVANGNVNAASGFLAEAEQEIGVIGDSE
jgi:hypothetical protein